MANVIEHKKYVAVNPQENNNKIWQFSVLDDGTMFFEYGRVGNPLNKTKPEPHDTKKLLAKIREKTSSKRSDFYSEITIVGNEIAPTKIAVSSSISKEEIKRRAEIEIGAGCPIVSALVKKLAEANRHELLVASGGELDIDLSTGIVRTAMGVVTAENVTKARKALSMMTPLVKKKDFDNPLFTAELGAYLRLVPQKTPPRRGWHSTFIPDNSAIQKQSSLLDQLEASIDLAASRITEASNAPKSETKPTSIFEVTMKIVDDKKIVDMVNKKFYDTRQSMHQSSRLKPTRVYEINIPHMSSAFEVDGRKVGNIKTLWHGTRMFNVLSIMKRGLILPKTLSTMQLAGAMFGNGIYFSDQSTKSLNYAHGYWDGGKRDSTCYMFLADVAMGREYVPSGPCDGQKSNYDSCFAKPGVSGVMNSEMIVYRTSQSNLRYLVEFSE